MKMVSFFLVSIATLSSYAQQEDYKYNGYYRETGDIYPSKVYVDSCPRAKDPQCPRKADEFYATFIDLSLKNQVEAKLNETALVRVNSYGESNDRSVLAAAQKVIMDLNSQAIKQGLNNLQTISFMMKDDRLSQAATFNAIVRLIATMDEMKK